MDSKMLLSMEARVNKKNKKMKSFIRIIMLATLMGVMSCDYLDVVPNDTATLEHTFSNRSVMDKFMRTVYSYLPDPTNPHYYPAYFTSRDEFDWRTDVRVGNLDRKSTRLNSSHVK